ncbi:NUDIX domain-containing protein [uncultured Arcanobacterium sp.]|uniref:NUDIX domain-containing protein n=1 Tax=uncultured Arcanobacterium sp. TaxID=487520 RepID=UPI0026112C50|nr:NUDIX hydrolase [uncultured Arcanobacterium sp.]
MWKENESALAVDLCDIDVPAHVQIAASKECFQSPIFTIYDDEIEFASGDKVKRQYMQHANAVAVVALRAKDVQEKVTEEPEGVREGTTKLEYAGEKNWEVLLIRQYRHAPRRLFWEIPAGVCDVAGEHPEQSAQRELLEEADVKATYWEKLVSFYASPGCSTERLDIYLASGIVEAAAENTFVREAEEREIYCRWFPLTHVQEQIRRGALTSPTLVTGILALGDFLATGKSPQL